MIRLSGFREFGFEPEAALINFLAFLGWNPGDEREIFSVWMNLVEVFLTRIRLLRGGARFDYQKALWFNQQHIHGMTKSISLFA